MDEKIPNQKSDDVTQQPVPSVGTGKKEAGTTVTIETEPKPKEVNGYSTRSEDEVPELPDIGLRAAAESIPIPTQTSPNLEEQFSEDRARQVLKQGPGNNLDVKQHYEGIYFVRSIFAKAILWLKNLKKNPERQPT